MIVQVRRSFTDSIYYITANYFIDLDIMHKLYPHLLKLHSGITDKKLTKTARRRIKLANDEDL